jgi:hypothetical protein
LALEHRRVVDEVPALGRLRHRQHHLVVGAEGLLEEVVRARAHRLDRHLHVSERRHHDDLDSGVAAAELLQQLEAVHLRHHQIDQRDVHALALEQSQRCRPIFDGNGFHPTRGQHPHDTSAESGLIIDNEDSRCPGLGEAHGRRLRWCVCQVDHRFPWTRQRRN